MTTATMADNKYFLIRQLIFGSGELNIFATQNKKLCFGSQNNKKKNS